VYQIFLKLFRLVLCITILSLSQNAFSQNQKLIDSLTLKLNDAQGIDRYELFIDLAIQHVNSNKDLCLNNLFQAEKVALEAGDTAKIVNARRITGEVFRRYERNNEAIEILTETLPLARRHKLQNEVKFILNTLALVYTTKADYDKALEYHFESLLIREVDGNKKEISISLNNIGFVYFKLKSYEKAVDFYNRSLQLKRQENDRYDLDRLLINIGLGYNQLGNFKEAQKNFNEAFEVCGDNCSNDIQVEGEFGLGLTYFGLGQFDEALIHFEKSYAIASKFEYKRFQIENLNNIAAILIRKGDKLAAVNYLKKAETIANTLGYNELLIDTYKQFSILYDQTKDFQNAAIYQGKYINLKDSVYSQRLIDNLAKIQTNFEERENIKTIANKEEVIQQQRSLYLAFVIIAILATFLIFVLYRSNRVKRKVNQALSDAKAIIEDQNQQLLSSNFSLDRELKEKNTELEKANESLLRVNEELDNFIYKTSHDIRGPLASLKGMCNVALMDVKDALALNYLKKLDITAEKLNTILTRLLIVNQINNSTLGLEKIDFPGIVTDVLLLEKKKGLPPRLKIKKHIDESIEFYSDKEFVRIILENLIDNAIKFYNDSQRIEPFVDISVNEEADHIKIKVVDNGIGISEVHPDKIFQMFSRASERSETGGIGLYITKTATEKLGGSVHLKTTPDGYTEFFVVLPMSTTKVFV
jgi:signal transduction histidine kinase/Flp pilus assembly protein TadD